MTRVDLSVCATGTQNAYTHTSSLSLRACLGTAVLLPVAARPGGLPGTSRGVLGSRSGIKPMPGPMWLRYGLNAIQGLVVREGVMGNVVCGFQKLAFNTSVPPNIY